MNSFSQFQNRVYNHPLYSEIHNNQKKNTFGSEKNHLEFENSINTKVKSRNHLNNQSLQSEINQQLIKEIKVKNQILTAQLEEYKLLVINMQKKVGELKRENKELNQKLIELSNSTQIITKLHNDQKESLMQTIPLQNMFKQQINQKESINCYEIQQILAKFQPKSFSKVLTKRSIEDQLVKIVQQKYQMQNFVNSLWELKDKIEPGNQQYLYQLWKWLKIVAINYYQIKQYKNLSDQKRTKKERS